MRASRRTEEELNGLCDEALGNARSDRERLQKYVERLTRLVDEADTDAEAANFASSLCEPIVRAHDTLVKLNNQIVDLAQIQLKKLAKSGGKTKEEEEAETDRTFDEIERSKGIDEHGKA